MDHDGGMVASGYDPAAWESFAEAEVAAASALAGLLVVAASINIGRIIKIPWIVSRLAGTLVLFGAVLIVATLLLVPQQPRVLLGIEIAAVGVIAALSIWVARGVPGHDSQYRTNAIVVATFGILASLLIATAGLFVSVGVLGGLYWLVPGTVLAFTIGLGTAWVALVEILR
jgi:modulator of FtsH protease